MVEVRGGGTRYPIAQRRRLLKAAHIRRAEGWSWSRIGDALGVPGETLRWWSERAAKAEPPRHGSTAMLPVVITASERSEPMPLALVSPSGWRFEGISIAVAVDLVRRLGC